MTEMAEMVARALCRTYCEKERANHSDGETVADYVDGHFDAWADEARAAIQAMREPTRPMKRAGGAELASEDDGGRPLHHLATEVWKHMIDAALSDDGSKEG